MSTNPDPAPTLIVDIESLRQPGGGSPSRAPDLVDAEALRPAGGGAPFFEGAAHGGIPATFFVVEAPAGAGPRLHSHPYAEVFVVRDGAARFGVGEDVFDVRAGQIVVAPAGVPHRFVNSGQETLRTVNIQPVASMVVDWLED